MLTFQQNPWNFSSSKYYGTVKPSIVFLTGKKVEFQAKEICAKFVPPNHHEVFLIIKSPGIMEFHQQKLETGSISCNPLEKKSIPYKETWLEK